MMQSMETEPKTYRPRGPDYRVRTMIDSGLAPMLG